MIELACVRPKKEHAELIFKWHVDPKTREMSFEREPKPWEEFFEAFLSKSFGESPLPPLFLLFQGEKIGFANFSIASHPTHPELSCYEISINLAPEKRDLGLGTKSLQELNVWAKERGVDALSARIKEKNLASKRAFLKAGYKKVGRQGDVELYLYSFVKERRAVFIVAEAGSNWHVGSDRENRKAAFELIERAAEAGADAVKFQVFNSERTYVAEAGKSRYLKGVEISELFKELEMPDELIPDLVEQCKTCGIEWMASSFSPEDFWKVDPYVVRHKIASYEIGYFQLIDLAARSGKPLILSTGASDIEEIQWAVERFKKLGGNELTLLQCSTCYPAPEEILNLRVIPWLKSFFRVNSGLSDHSLHPTRAPLAAAALGASVIEKHFTIKRGLSGPDHAFAIEPQELKEMVSGIRAVEKMLGSGYKRVEEEEEELHEFAKRGVQAISFIQKGDPLIEGENVAVLRPGNQKRGVHPKFLEEIKEAKATRAIEKGSGIQPGDWI